MLKIDSQFMRHVARCEVERLFPGIAPKPLDDYATSLVRQWQTNDSRAGVFTVAVNYWLHLELRNGKLNAVLETCPSRMKEFLEQWGAQQHDLAVIVQRLSLAQRATFVNAHGLTVRVTAHPKDHSFQFAAVKDEDPLP
jgi:hypothetical protein